MFCGFVLLNTAIVLYDQHNENQFIKKYLIETVVPHVLLLLFVTYSCRFHNTNPTDIIIATFLTLSRFFFKPGLIIEIKKLYP